VFASYLVCTSIVFVEYSHMIIMNIRVVYLNSMLRKLSSVFAGVLYVALVQYE
jgi:hypothetical protein